jgi:hypothetical protein
MAPQSILDAAYIATAGGMKVIGHGDFRPA